MKIATVVGARPQFIKAAAVSRFIRKCKNVEETIIHTGQHFDANMSDVFFRELDIPRPDYQLGIGGGTHGQNTGRMIEAIESILLKEKPNVVLVYGDTDSTLAAAVAAVKLHLPVAHVEAGLRSFNRNMPEEINRILTDHASKLLFAPTDTAVSNLAREGICGDRVYRTGDVMFDQALFCSNKAEEYSCILKTLRLSSKHYILATLHREENTDDSVRLASILRGLSSSSLPVVLPLHPRTRQRLADFGLTIPPAIRPIDPVGYLDMTLLEKHACLIATDSGGVQKEAFFHRVPCLTLREETEWVELVELGVNLLIGCDADKIAEALSVRPVFSNQVQGLYGDGNSAECIVEILSASFFAL